MRVIYQWYYNFYNKLNKINRILLIIIISHNVYNAVDSLASAGQIDLDMIGIPWVFYFMWKIGNNLFYKLFGKYWILKLNRWQTKEFQKKVMDKNIKAAGKRGGYKDTSQAGFVSDFCTVCKDSIKEKIKEMKVFLYRFDLPKIDKYIEEHMDFFNVCSKKEKRANFMTAICENSLFLKEKYLDEQQQILDDFKSIKYVMLSKSKYIISDSVNFQHLVSMLYDYMYFRWRLEADVWVISNQPYFQNYNYRNKKYKMAKIYSPDLKATKNRKVKVVEDGKTVEYISVDNMISEDWICFWESEADIWWNNIDNNVRQNIQERGLRWGEVAVRHINGEHVMSLRNGQVAGRTAKIQRDLEESFYSVTRAVKVYGGAKRIFFIKIFIRLCFPMFRFWPGLKCSLVKKMNELKMSGWIKLETVFARSEAINYQAPAVSLTALLDKENSLYMNQYQTTLVFNFRDCWTKYNTHYMEYLGETLTENSKALFKDLPEWTPDLKLHEEQIIEMNYDTVDLFDIPEDKKYKNNRKYKKVDKTNKNAMRL